MKGCVYSPALLLRGSEQVRSQLMLVHGQPRRGQQSSAAVVVPKVGDAKPTPTGSLGRLNNAADFAVTKLEHLINWGRNISKI